uniref:Uncharacterized protein n=1 Tax=Setaria viridis TaxID=4556 RepID=A0A4U6VXT7_SETVI|nr:hypothetical protein SEVIR_2G299850v2 [Setaria viridis]
MFRPGPPPLSTVADGPIPRQELDVYECSFQFDGFISSSKECLTAKARASESFMSYNWESSNAKRKWLLR